MASSLDVRQDIMVVEVPKLRKEAADKAIKEWGQPQSKITHLVFYTCCSVDMPGTDHQLTKLLDLPPSVRHLMMCQQGCYAGGTILRVAKDLAENNKGARVLVVCSEITVICFHGPSDANLGSLLGEALFSDGAASMIIGADPDTSMERPIFELVSAAQTILPNSEGSIEGHLREVGLMVQLLKTLPAIISDNIEKSLVEAMDPGGWAILDKVEAKLGLEKEKLKATRHVLSEYGNMWSTFVLFIMDEMRKKSMREGRVTAEEGLEWGVLFGFGLGVTVETVVLHSVPVGGDGDY